MKKICQFVVRLEIEGDQEQVVDALKYALDAGVLQEAINAHEGAQVVSAVSEYVPTFKRHDGIIHDDVTIHDDSDEDTRGLKVAVIAGDHAEDTIGVHVHDAVLNASFGGTPLQVELLGQLMLAAARDTMTRARVRTGRAIRP